MAKKNKNSSNRISEPQGFTHGMVSDPDPRFQLKGSYADAKNIRLTNSEGDTFTVQNIDGNSQFVDLFAIQNQVKSQAQGILGRTTGLNVTGSTDIFSEIYADPNTFLTVAGDQQAGENWPTDGWHPFYDENHPDANNTGLLSLEGRASIVGHTSYGNEMILIIVARYMYETTSIAGGGTLSSKKAEHTPTSQNYHDGVDRTIFLKVEFNSELKVEKVTDLLVCYNTEATWGGYPDLGMSLDTPVRIEHIVENDCISRIYWTDNKNPLRTLNINQAGKNYISKDALDITPLMSPSQPVLDSTLHGSLPVGVYQYSYKYISANGGETTFSPLSNMYHVSDQSFGSSNTYGGGPEGELGSQGFRIMVNDLDADFEYVELYALLFEELNSPPKVALVNRKRVVGLTSIDFTHVSWNNEIENGLEEVLIEQNTWDICKDIAIKDNILFAANLRQKKNWISEKEWNVKVLRYNIGGTSSTDAKGVLTTNDSEIKHYDGSGEIIDGTTNEYSQTVSHGYLLGDTPGAYVQGHAEAEWDGTTGTPCWTTLLENQRTSTRSTPTSSSPELSGYIQSTLQYRYLPDQMTLGAESFNYTENDLGGCRVTFGIKERVADQTQNTSTSPYISATNEGGSFQTDNLFDNVGGTTQGTYTAGTATTFKASMSLGGSKDPHAAGDTRGYQRGDVYRFGVQIYDLAGAPGNVLWIGDIQTPEQHDVLRMIDTDNAWYSPSIPTLGAAAASATFPNGSLDQGRSGGGVVNKLLVSHKYCQDHRLSYVYGHVVPPIDVEWFSGRLALSHKNLNAYLQPNGAQQLNLPNSGATDMSPTSEGLRKAVPNVWNHASSGPGDLDEHNDTHYLFDLYVNFEFMIPEDVCKKISGFRVVRAERKEEDKRIVQQGLLNQTAQYGVAGRDLEYGYGKARFSAGDNEGFDGDPIFTNAENKTTPTKVEQPEYNTYLNGYLGLAENSHLGFFADGISDGEITSTSGNFETEHTGFSIFAWPEREDGKAYGSAGVYKAAGHWNNSNTGNFGGPNMYGVHQRHSAYFGSHDKMFKMKQDATGQYVEHHNQIGAPHVSGSVFTLDSPDSAFGVRPYVYRDGDLLRVDCSLKLTDEQRYKDHDQNWAHPGNSGPYAYWTYCREKLKTDTFSAGASTDVEFGTFHLGSSYPSGGPTDPSSTYGTLLTWAPRSTAETIENALHFCKRRDINKDYGILIGKYYCFDPYFGIGMEIDGGQFAADNHKGLGNEVRAHAQYGYTLPISNSKELGDGELVPSGFFTKSQKVKRGFSLGFSNNTLGYVRSYMEHDTTTGPISCYMFDAAHAKIAKIYSPGNSYDSVKEEDYTYDTVSTVQMGLRSILLEVSTAVSEVRRTSKDGVTFGSWFEGGTGAASYWRYNSWFAPINLGALYEGADWKGYYMSGSGSNASRIHEDSNQAGTCFDSRYYPCYRSGLLSSYPMDGIDRGSHHSGNAQGSGTIDSSRGKSLIPYKYLCSVVRRVTPYGGYSKAAIRSTRYISCGNFHPVGFNNIGKQGHLSKVFGGDTFVNLYSHQKTSTPYMKKSMARWQVFPVESYVNTDMRSGLNLNNGDTELGKSAKNPPFSNDWLYNSAYSQENSIKSSVMIDEDKTCESQNLPYEIAYSKTKISGEDGDAFRSFPIHQFHDMEGLYGEINRIINFKNEIYVFQDRGFAKLLVNPLSMLKDDTGTALFTGTGETVENHIYISTKYGTRHRFSVTTSELAVYFVDVNYARLFKYDNEKLVSLGDSLGMRNYLRHITKDFEVVPRLECSTHTYWHPIRPGYLDSVEKEKYYAQDGGAIQSGRNYHSDNPLKFLGIYSVFDHQKKELMVTFHNSYFPDVFEHETTGGLQGLKRAANREFFINHNQNHDNHWHYSSVSGNKARISETLVFNEGVNAFTSKFSVAPPQWISGNQGAFILCPENEISVHSIANIGNAGENAHRPYYQVGSKDGQYDEQYRCNPLSLWLWNKHEDGDKTHFFGKKDDTVVRLFNHDWEIPKPSDGSMTTGQSAINHLPGSKNVAEESYIVKVINDDAGNSKVFDNVKIPMTPEFVNHSSVYFSTELVDNQEVVISKKWDFDDTGDGFIYRDGTNLIKPVVNVGASTIRVAGSGDVQISSPRFGMLKFDGKFNYLVRARIKRISGTDWTGACYWEGFRKPELGNHTSWWFSGDRKKTVSLPDGIDSDFVIVQWDLRGASTNSNEDISNTIVNSYRLDLHDGSSEFDIDWIEVGGFKLSKYHSAQLRLPLRTEESTRRARGTWAKIKYTAQTTDKFNIFAIIAKYRDTFR